MKSRILSVFAALALTLSTHAGLVWTDSIQSNVLRATIKYNVYLPDAAVKQTDRTFPVVYLLHGLTDDYKAWVEKGQMQTVADELIESGEAVPMIIIMPNAGGPDTHSTWNGYFNMPGWNYEDFFFTELIPQAEQKYRGISDKEHRAIMGLSMGGGGSTVYSQRHPDQFSSCYAMSAWLESEEGKPGQDGKKDKMALVMDAVMKHSALQFVEKADKETLSKLGTVKWFLDCGDDDFLMDQSVKLHQLMRNKGLKDELRIRNGVHNWEYWHTALRTALPFASRNFAR